MWISAMRRGIGGAPAEYRVRREKMLRVVKSGRSFEKREVKVGRTNDLDAVVLSGLAEGDVVRRMADVGSAQLEKQ